MSQRHEQQQERSRLKNQTKALYQAQRRANPVVRSLEQSSNTGQRRIAREVLGVQEQEQSANSQQRVGGVWGGVPPRSSSAVGHGYGGILIPLKWRGSMLRS